MFFEKKFSTMNGYWILSRNSLFVGYIDSRKDGQFIVSLKAIKDLLFCWNQKV